MMYRLRTNSIAGVMALVLAASLSADEGVDLYGRLIEEKAPALVTVKFLLRLEGQFGKREVESEITGMMIDPKGMVLCANSRLGGGRRFGSARPTDIKILIGDDIEGIDATLIARDTELDLSWVRVKEPPAKPFAYIDLSASANARAGEALYTVRRMAKFFDRATTVTQGFLSGRTSKPRDLLIPGGGLNLEQGQPVFTAGGALVGVVVLQLPEDEEMQSNPMAVMAMRNDIVNGLILPASRVLEATDRARQSAAEDEEEGDDDDGANDESDDDAEGAKDVEKESDDGDEE
jgi:hypothetical protein